MKQTAVQEVFSELEKLHPQLFNVYTAEGKEFINHFHNYLAIEKDQMELCYKVGVIDGSNGVMFKFDKYYNETYKKK
jgi:hypothetical protein